MMTWQGAPCRMDERPRAGRCPAGCRRRSSPPAATPAPGGASHASAPPTTAMQVKKNSKILPLSAISLKFDILRGTIFFIRNLVLNFTVPKIYFLLFKEINFPNECQNGVQEAFLRIKIKLGTGTNCRYLRY